MNCIGDGKIACFTRPTSKTCYFTQTESVNQQLVKTVSGNRQISATVFFDEIIFEQLHTKGAETP